MAVAEITKGKTVKVRYHICNVNEETFVMSSMTAQCVNNERNIIYKNKLENSLTNISSRYSY